MLAANLRKVFKTLAFLICAAAPAHGQSAASGEEQAADAISLLCGNPQFDFAEVAELADLREWPTVTGTVLEDLAATWETQAVLGWYVDDPAIYGIPFFLFIGTVVNLDQNTSRCEMNIAGVDPAPTMRSLIARHEFGLKSLHSHDKSFVALLRRPAAPRMDVRLLLDQSGKTLVQSVLNR